MGFKNYSKQAIQICNDLFRYISRYPILKKRIDIDDNIRAEYNILLNENFLKHTPIADLVLMKQFLYDIREK